VTDAYIYSNYRQRYWSPADNIDPVTGERYNLDYMGQKDANGVYVYVPRQYSSPIENLLTVPATDLDPAQNPAGTRWFIAGNIFAVGDEDISNNSRWLEIAPHRNGSTFTFTYPNGSQGQLDIRTMPGLNPPNTHSGGGFGDRMSATAGISIAAGQGHETAPVEPFGTSVQVRPEEVDRWLSNLNAQLALGLAPGTQDQTRTAEKPLIVPGQQVETVLEEGFDGWTGGVSNLE
jgi:hypothetical protein